MAGFWRDTLSNRRISSLNYDYVADLHRAHVVGAGQFEEVLWRVASLELWHRRWVEMDTSVGLTVPEAPRTLTPAAQASG
jgi:hypothetical protein